MISILDNTIHFDGKISGWCNPPPPPSLLRVSAVVPSSKLGQGEDIALGALPAAKDSAFLFLFYFDPPPPLPHGLI